MSLYGLTKSMIFQLKCDKNQIIVLHFMWLKYVISTSGNGPPLPNDAGPDKTDVSPVTLSFPRPITWFRFHLIHSNIRYDVWLFLWLHHYLYHLFTLKYMNWWACRVGSWGVARYLFTFCPIQFLCAFTLVFLSKVILANLSRPGWYGSVILVLLHIGLLISIN